MQIEVYVHRGRSNLEKDFTNNQLFTFALFAKARAAAKEDKP